MTNRHPHAVSPWYAIGRPVQRQRLATGLALRGHAQSGSSRTYLYSGASGVATCTWSWLLITAKAYARLSSRTYYQRTFVDAKHTNRTIKSVGSTTQLTDPRYEAVQKHARQAMHSTVALNQVPNDLASFVRQRCVTSDARADRALVVVPEATHMSPVLIAEHSNRQGRHQPQLPMQEWTVVREFTQ